MTSLGEFYPQYMRGADVFRCPLRRGNPRFVVNIPIAPDGSAATRQTSPYLYGLRNWTLLNSAYGYDCRLYESLPSHHPLVADMPDADGTFRTHYGGFNVLYPDWTAIRKPADPYGKHVSTEAAVRWRQTAFCSTDPLDNIFIENAWSADTDSFISDNRSPFNRAAQAAGQYNDLTISYDTYKDLWPVNP